MFLYRNICHGHRGVFKTPLHDLREGGLETPKTPGSAAGSSIQSGLLRQQRVLYL